MVNLLDILTTVLLFSQLDIQLHDIGLGVVLGGDYTHDTGANTVEGRLSVGGVRGLGEGSGLLQNVGHKSGEIK